ncbi:hypothetical protein HBI30_018670 [Parastagonospora nodorum]|nr:hypothetical protein HBI30_018670 [Parastagonospora nodorum]
MPTPQPRTLHPLLRPVLGRLRMPLPELPPASEMLPRMRRVLTIVPLHAPRLPSVSVCSPDLHSPQSGAPLCLFPQSRHTQIGPEAEADETKQQTLSCLKVTASRVSSLGPSAGSVAASGLDLEAV